MSGPSTVTALPDGGPELLMSSGTSSAVDRNQSTPFVQSLYLDFSLCFCGTLHTECLSGGEQHKVTPQKALTTSRNVMARVSLSCQWSRFCKPTSSTFARSTREEPPSLAGEAGRAGLPLRGQPLAFA